MTIDKFIYGDIKMLLINYPFYGIIASRGTPRTASARTDKHNKRKPRGQKMAVEYTALCPRGLF